MLTRLLCFLCLIATTLHAAPKTFYFSDIPLVLAGTKDTPVARLFSYIPQDQNPASIQAQYFILIMKADKANVDDWFKNVIGQLTSDTQIMKRDDKNHLLAFVTTRGDDLEYDYWKYGTDQSGQAVANGIAWHFNKTTDKAAYDDFMKTKADRYFQALINSPIMSFTPGEI